MELTGRLQIVYLNSSESPVKKTKVLTQETFDRMLNWLDSDRVRAGEKYEEIRKRLIMVLKHRGSHDPETLADEVIDRVALKVEEIAREYKGDPARYYYGVAINVFRESLRQLAQSDPLPLPESADEKEARCSCLEQCLESITPESRQIILLYFQAESLSKSEFRKDLAERMSLNLNTLRQRVHRARLELKECVQRCLERRNFI